METPNEVALSVNWISRQIVKFGQILAIDEDLWEEHINQKINPIWHTMYDQLRFFNYCTDGSYMCEKRKRIPNKDNPSDFAWKNYIWYELPDLDAKGLYKLFKDVYEYQQTRIEELKQKKLTESVNAYDVKVIEQIKTLRVDLLTRCDWMFTTDSVVDPDMLEMWKLYRQKLRDLPADNADTKDKLFWKIPLTPKQFLEQEETIEKELNDPEKAESTAKYLEQENYIPKQPYLSIPGHYFSYSVVRDNYPEQEQNFSVNGYFSTPSKNVEIEQ